METPKAKLIKAKFFEENPEYTEVEPDTHCATIADFQDIGNDEEEVWLMQCPKGMEISSFMGEKMKLPGRSKLDDIEAIAREWDSPQSHAFGYCNRKGRYSLRLLNVRGEIVVRNRYKGRALITEEIIREVCPPMKRVPAPEFLKVRHPLLGFNYEEKLKIDQSTEEKLLQADENSLNELRNRLRNPLKGQTKIKVEKDKYQGFEEKLGNWLFGDKPEKRKRKHKESANAEVSLNTTQETIEEPLTKKIKKEKIN